MTRKRSWPEIIATLERMEGRPWWHPHRWRLRWWDATQPIRVRWWKSRG